MTFSEDSTQRTTKRNKQLNKQKFKLSKRSDDAPNPDRTAFRKYMKGSSDNIRSGKLAESRIKKIEQSKIRAKERRNAAKDMSELDKDSEYDFMGDQQQDNEIDTDSY
jgi:hypothetical protein